MTQPDIHKSSAVGEMGDRGKNRQGQKRRGCCALLRGRVAGSPSNTIWPGLRSTSVPSGSGILINQPFGHNRHGLRGSAPFWGRAAGSPCNTISLGLRPNSLPSGILIHPIIWPQQIWAENAGLCPYGAGGAGSPSNTMWPGPSPTCM